MSKPKSSTTGLLTIWSAVRLAAFYICTDAVVSYRGLFLPKPLSLVGAIAKGEKWEDRQDDGWHRRNKVLLPGLVFAAGAGALAHFFGYRYASRRAGSTGATRLELPFGLEKHVPKPDDVWLKRAFIGLFHVVPFLATIYLSVEFFNHPNLYYNDNGNNQVWCTFFSAETWDILGLFHRSPILWSNDIEFVRFMYPVLLSILLGFHLFALVRFWGALYKTERQVTAPGARRITGSEPIRRQAPKSRHSGRQRR